MTAAALLARSISKRFGAVAALDGVSFTLKEGEIRALCGENGAGKSTLVKVLMGIHLPDVGAIEIGGTPVAIRSPQEAQSLGLGIVAQELSLAPRLSILDNIWLGSPRVPLIYRIPDLRRRAAAAMELLGVGDWDLDAQVHTLPIGQRQLVEIARLIARNSKILILDEPTATLNDREIERLIEVLKRLQAQGHAIIYITHRLGEVFQLCDSITVLRNGRHVGTAPIGEVSRHALVEMMLGRALSDMYPARLPLSADPPAVKVSGLSIPGAVHGISFSAARGRILGLAGQIGSGASAVTRALAGLVPDATGDVRIDGAALPLGSVPAAVARNIVFLSEDRAAEGLFHALKVAENLVATSLARHRRGGLLDWGALTTNATERARSVGVDLARLKARAGTLSGGNQQKVLFGRALKDAASGVLLMNEPTRGIDVGARADVYRLMRQLCEKGYTLIMTTSDIEEMIAMSDNIVTLYRGRVVGRYDRDGIAAATVLADITHPTSGDAAA